MGQLTISDFEAARSRIVPHIRRTPLVQASALKQSLPGMNPVGMYAGDRLIQS